MSYGQKRQALRIQPFVAPCRYLSGEQRLPGFLTDLSSRGGRLHTDFEPPAADERITVEVRLGRKATHVRLRCAVAWVKPSPRGGHVFGVSFEGNGPDEQQAVDAVVEEFRRRAASLE